MPTVAFANLGCKVNQYETDRIAESFAMHGFEIGEFDQPADIYVINTCSVTSAADRKSRHMARRAARQKPSCKVVLTGCFAQLALDTGELVDGAALLVPNRQKMRVAELALEAFPELKSNDLSIPNFPSRIAVFPEQAGLVPLSSLGVKGSVSGHTRATLKVQDGCEHFCAFCSIPYTRNTMASRSLSAVVSEARAMAERGFKEVVVTGVCVGAYVDEESGSDLADLLAALGKIEGLLRVRLSSLQPIETTDKLIDVISQNTSICPHLHLSLQSGDDFVLKQMQRPYDTAYYRDLVMRLRARMPGIAITTDIIVGFPGETEALFKNTAEFAREVGFSDAHIFKYSPRERTFASNNYADTVHPQEKDRRHKALTAICDASKREFAQRLVGKTVDVIAERRGKSDGWLAGFTDSYVRVHFEAGGTLSGEVAQVLVEGVAEDGDAVGILTGCGISASGRMNEREPAGATAQR